MSKSKDSVIRMNIAKELCNEFTLAFPAKILSFIVYGSVATGKAKETSDIDIQIISDNPVELIRQKSEQIVHKVQKKSGVKIMVNAKTPAFLIEELTQGDSFHVLMFLNGNCLLKSRMFTTLRNLVEETNLPPRATIENKIREEIKLWSDDLFSNRLINFLSDNSLSIFQYIAFKRVIENDFDSWSEQEEKIQRASHHAPHIEELMPKHAVCVNNFLTLNKGIDMTQTNLNSDYEFNLIELLVSMRNILHETKETM